MIPEARLKILPQLQVGFVVMIVVKVLEIVYVPHFHQEISTGSNTVNVLILLDDEIAQLPFFSAIASRQSPGLLQPAISELDGLQHRNLNGISAMLVSGDIGAPLAARFP
jgi:hypothetical protein